MTGLSCAAVGKGVWLYFINKCIQLNHRMGEIRSKKSHSEAQQIWDGDCTALQVLLYSPESTLADTACSTGVFDAGGAIGFFTNVT